VPRSSQRSFIGRVRDHLNELPPTERRLGEFILDFPGELASYTASELAGLAHVSNASVTRFFRHLGYDSFDAARRQVRAEQQSGAALLLSSVAANESDAAHVAQAHRNIDATFYRLPDTALTEIAAAIVAARQVVIVGYRSSNAFAAYLRWQILQVVEQTRVIPGAGETLGEYTAGFAATDCVIIFGLRRSVPQLAEILTSATSAGAKVAYVTDQPNAPATPARWLIRCDTQAPGPLYNHASVMAVCDLLATKVLAAAGSAGRKRMAAIEAAHDIHSELE